MPHDSSPLFDSKPGLLQNYIYIYIYSFAINLACCQKEGNCHVAFKTQGMKINSQRKISGHGSATYPTCLH